MRYHRAVELADGRRVGFARFLRATGPGARLAANVALPS